MTKIWVFRMITLFLLCGLMISGCSDDPPRGVTSIAANDPELEKATVEARESVDVFLKHLQNSRDNERSFAVKVEFLSKGSWKDTVLYGGKSDIMWVSDLSFDGESLEGKLENDPKHIEGLKMGDTVKVKPKEVVDWMFTENDCLVGGYTEKVLRKRVPERDRLKFDHNSGYKLCGVGSIDPWVSTSTWWNIIGEGDVETVRELIDKGAVLDPNCYPNQRCKPLAIAADTGNLEMIRLLIDGGADLNGHNAYGDTPLIYAAMSSKPNRRETFLLLVESGANVNEPNCFGMTPFLGSSAEGNVEFVEACLKNGALVNWTFPGSCGGGQDTKTTALMYAASEGHIDVVRLLLENGADVSIVDAKGHDARYYAKEGGYKDVEAFFGK